MEQIIYADVLFFIDLSMDFLALYITAKMFKIRFYSGRAFASSVIGALYSVISVILRSENLFVLIFISVLMCLITFKTCSLVTKIKALFIFYAVNMLLGGVMTVVFNMFNSITDSELLLLIYGDVKTVRGGMPIGVFYVGFVLTLVGYKLISKAISRRPSSTPFKITVEVGGRCAEFTVSEDSGNMVKEPISGEPIIFIKETSLNRILNMQVISAMKIGSEIYNLKTRNKLRLVVYQTLSGSEMCACLKPDRVVVGKDEKTAWIAIGKQIFMKDVDGILPSELLG